jgi:hypothetical protein
MGSETVTTLEVCKVRITPIEDCVLNVTFSPIFFSAAVNKRRLL